MKSRKAKFPELGLWFTDLSYVLRSLRRSPVFSAAAVLTIALGVGANTAVFGFIDAVLIQPLPFRDPGSLMQIWETHPEFPTLQVAAPDYLDWQRSARSTVQMAAYTFQAINRVTVFERDQAEQVQATVASWQLLPMLEVKPLLGRNFLPEDEARGQHVVGLLAGAVMAALLARLMGSLLYQVAPGDPIALAAAAIMLLFLSLVSVILPLRRILKLEPWFALREE